MKHVKQTIRADRAGIAIVPVMLIVSGLAIFTMALTTATLSGNRSLQTQSEDYHLSSSVESVAVLAMEDVWTDFLEYVETQGGADPTIEAFRTYMNLENIFDQADKFDEDDDGVVELIPRPGDGTDLLPGLGLPNRNGELQFNDVNVDAVEIVRVDLVNSDTTQLFITVSASTTKGDGIVNPIMNRAVQQVYTVEPDSFEGFEYAVLANNVNCIFCHMNVDTVDRFFNSDPASYGTFDKARVGTLESLLVRHNMDGDASVYNDYDADSFVAGAVYTRGQVVQHDGAPIADWDELTWKSFAFDPATGKLEEDAWGEMTLDSFSPAGDPPLPGENLYLDYALSIGEQVDGPLPSFFPSPIPDDGGKDPATGLPDPAAIGNRTIDDVEFSKVAETATGAITAGIVNVSAHDEQIVTAQQYAQAVFEGNRNSIQQSVDGNVVLTGTQQNPIRIDGTVAIDGDLILQGWVQGEGTLLVRGNVYVPTDLVYLDGVDADGNRTFGVNNGTRNALGVTAGGNILIGDYQRPASLQPDESYSLPGKYEIISGNPDTGDPMVDQWSFPLAEIALFNRGEWSKTQALLPGQGDDFADPSSWSVVNAESRVHPLLPGPGDDPTDPSTWSVPNANYDADWKPRYYGYGDDTTIPIYNKAPSTAPDPLDPDAKFLYYDGNLRSWIGEEAALGWDTTLLTYADPNDPNDPLLFDAFGNQIAVTAQLTPKDDWIAPDIYQQAIEWFHDNRGPLDLQPMNIDGLLYTNNAIFSIVNKTTNFRGRMQVNGSLVASDLGMLVPGHKDLLWWNNRSPISNIAIGLQLNYDSRVKKLLNVTNPNRVQLKRTLWNPTANLMP